MKVTAHDKAILREVARKQLEYAHSERNMKTQQEWYRHSRFEKGSPMIHLELWTFGHEIIPKRLQCETELGRRIETSLYSNFLNFEIFGDDRVVPDYFPIAWDIYFDLFDIRIESIHASDGKGSDLGHQFQHVISNLQEDTAKLKPSTYGVRREKTLQYKDFVDDIFGDILPTKMQMGSLDASPTQKLVHMMGMETMLFSMYDYPDLFKEVMNRVADDYIAHFKWMEKEGLLFPTTDKELLCQGSFCFTQDLPNRTDQLTTKEVWGYMDSQETVGISPEMFDEFIFPCYEKISKIFGLLSYGCCEPVHSFWEKNISKMTNLRKVSISPWCDEAYMGAQLKGKKIVYLRKPSPNFLGVDEVLNENAFRKHIQNTLKAAQGCQLEFAQRDVYTIHNSEKKAKRYIDIIRDEIEKNWI